LFTSAPQIPQKIEQWPNISEVIDALRSKSSDKYIVIIAVPSFAKPLLANYCQEVNAKAWEEYGKLHRKSNLRKGLELIGMDMGFRFKYFLRKIKNKVLK